jgi:hypothetical protein
MRVADLEGLANDVIDEVDLGAVHIGQRDLVDQHRRAVLLDHEIVLGAGCVEIEAILETGTPAARNRDTQGRAARFLRKDAGDALRGAVGQGDIERFSGHGLLPKIGVPCRCPNPIVRNAIGGVNRCGAIEGRGTREWKA